MGQRTAVVRSALAGVLVALASVLVVAADVHAQVDGVESSWNVTFGPLEIGPSLVVSNGFDTNVTRVGDMEPVSSYEFFTIPQADARYKLSNYDISGTFALEYAYTPGEQTDKKSATNTFIEGAFRSPETVFKPHVSYYRLSTYARTSPEFGQKSQRNNSTLDTGLDWAPGRLEFKSSYIWVSTRYAADEFYQDVSLAEKLNFDFHLPSVGVGYSVTPLLGIGTRAEFGVYNFLLAPERNGSGERLTGGVVLGPPAVVVGAVNAGYRGYQSDTEPDVRMNGWTADAVLLYLSGSSRVSGTFFRDMQFSWDESKALYTLTNLGLNYYRTLAWRLEGEVLADFDRVDYIKRDTFLEVPEGQQRRRVLGALGFRIRPWMRVGVNVEREVSTGTENWDAWRFTTYLYYGAYRFRKLDRPLPR